MRLSRDTLLGIAAVALAGAYWHETTGIQRSLLSDEVGADGVPRLLAAGMAISGLALALRGVLAPAPAGGGELPLRAHFRAAGLLAILALYLAALPVAGYAASIAGLLAAVAAYAGAPRGVAMAATAVAGAVAFWAMFVLLLGVPMPRGTWPWG